MSGIRIVNISVDEVTRILDFQESHFGDLKSIDIKPAKLTETLAALANAEGGEVYLGIDEDKVLSKRYWRGFQRPEDANGFVQIIEKLFPLGPYYSYEFLQCESYGGLILKIEIKKTSDIKRASNGKVYLRRGAQNLLMDTQEEIERLKRNKGLTSFETQTINAHTDIITTSDEVRRSISEVVPATIPSDWLRKQQLIYLDMPTVAGVLLFADEPQAVLPKQSGVKIYRYKTSAEEGTRETLAFDPISLEGPIYQQIKAAVGETTKIIESVRINTVDGLQHVLYPSTALHEIITNAVLHRDYAIADDIHIVVFDNRVEVKSPGTLPGHVTTENILRERFARNGAIVRIINKFPDPPNKDIGEGLNTAFRAMREMKLKDPEIVQEDLNVIVRLKHEPLAK